MSCRLLALALSLVLAPAVFAQNVISARAGYVNYIHGQVNLPPGSDMAPSRQLQDGQPLSTGEGRAELLLTPGSYLRLDRASEVRMVSNRLTDVQVELVSGTASLEVNELHKDSHITVLWRDQRIAVANAGLYRFEPNGETMRVYVMTGKLRLPSAKKDLKSKHYADLAAGGTMLASAKFDPKNMDSFDHFNASRDGELAYATQRAAYSFQSYPYALRSSLWYLDPFGGGFYTYMPYSGIYSPWGFYFYSPRYWVPPAYYYGGTGRSYGGGGGSNAGRIPTPVKGSTPPPGTVTPPVGSRPPIHRTAGPRAPHAGPPPYARSAPGGAWGGGRRSGGGGMMIGPSSTSSSPSSSSPRSVSPAPAPRSAPSMSRGGGGGGGGRGGRIPR